METKQIAAIVLVLLAAGIAYYVFALAPAPAEPSQENGETPVQEYAPPFAKPGENVTLQEFAANLLSADSVYIVEDVRELERYPLSRTHIMQCGVDYAGSQGFAGKEVVVYILDNEDVCGTIDGATTISECYQDILSASEEPGTMMIWIEKGTSPEMYARGMVVRINETYVQGTCTTTLVPPEEGEPGDEPLPDINISEMEGPGPVMLNETSNETAEETEEEPEEEGPGDSHTFP